MDYNPQNWVQAGLNSYLDLKRDDRAERAQEQTQQIQNEEMALKRADFLSKQKAHEMDMKIKQSELDDIDKLNDPNAYYNAVATYGYHKELQNPQTPTSQTIKDPKVVEASRYIYNSAKQTADFLNDPKNFPEGMRNMSIPMSQISTLPPFVQTTAQNVFAPAAAKRAGQESFDPTTNTVGIITGKMGNINVERDANGKAYISADMEVKNPDGSVRYAPFTNGTDDPNQPIKRMPVDFLKHEAEATLAGIDDAIESGLDPAATITARKLQGQKDVYAQMPKEQKKALWKNLMDEEKNKNTRESDVMLTKKAADTIKGMQAEIDKLDWKGDPQKSILDLQNMLASSGQLTADQVNKTVELVTKSKIKGAKNSIKEIGAGGDNVVQALVNEETGDTVKILGKPYPKHAKPSNTNNGELKPREELTSINNSISQVNMDIRSLRKDLRDASPNERDEIHKDIKAAKVKLADLEARQKELHRTVGRGVSANFAESQGDAVAGAKGLMSGEEKPKSFNGAIMGLNSL